MLDQRRIEDWGIRIGSLPRGNRNSITDVEGVLVGHSTIDRPDVKTGVTSVIPHGGNIFREKLPAAVHVINGFGKSTGLIQIMELGTLETPILLTNTFGVGTCTNALVRYMMDHNEDIGTTTGTVNPVVCECNDSYLNDIRGMHVKEEHALEAIGQAGTDFHEGGRGAGAGMSCYKLKGGIGSASRLVNLKENTFTLGMLVLTNMGRLRDLTIEGRRPGEEIREMHISDSSHRGAPEETRDRGSIIMIIATDAPLSSRQLGRISRRAEVGVSRTGNTIANGSGEIVIAFSTGQKILHYEERDLVPLQILNEEKIDPFFQAVAECAEEAVLNSMITAVRCEGISGHARESLVDFYAHTNSP